MNKGVADVYTKKELELMYDFYVHGKTFSELEITLRRGARGIITKLHRLRREEPEKWEAAYHFYLNRYSKIYGEEIREKIKERLIIKKRENIEIAKHISVLEGEVQKFDIRIS